MLAGVYYDYMRQLIGSMLNPGPSNTLPLPEPQPQPEPQLQLQQPQSSLRQSNPRTNMMLWMVKNLLG
jgi:hypothetical protein